MTVHTMRISSWVLRSGARRESMEAIHAFCACRTPGAHSWRNFSEGKGQTSSSTSMSRDSSGSSAWASGRGLIEEPSYWRVLDGSEGPAQEGWAQELGSGARLRSSAQELGSGA